MSPSRPPSLAIIGANHRTASLGVRDQLFVDDAAIPSFLQALGGQGIGDCMVLSTCDRVEVWASHPDGEMVCQVVGSLWADRIAQPYAALSPHLYRLTGVEALRHGFAVTSSLDSQVIGEPQVLGQVKAAHRMARDCGACGNGLEGYVQAAFACAKKVRSETAIGEGPVSIAAAAVQSARDLHGDLSRCRALLIGAGDMGELVAEHFLAAGISWMAVTAPRQSRAEALADVLGLNVLPFDGLRDALPGADVVICAVGGRHVVLTAAQISAALKQRRRKPIFVVDTAIPGNVEPALNRVDGAFLYDLADLEQVALDGRHSRELASRAAWAILEDDLAAFLKGCAARAAVPALVALRQHFEETRDQVLTECGDDAAQATRILINRLLHPPSDVMKHIAAEGAEWHSMESTLRKLFRLD